MCTFETKDILIFIYLKDILLNEPFNQLLILISSLIWHVQLQNQVDIFCRSTWKSNQMYLPYFSLYNALKMSKKQKCRNTMFHSRVSHSNIILEKALFFPVIYNNRLYVCNKCIYCYRNVKRIVWNEFWCFNVRINMRYGLKFFIISPHHFYIF